MRALTREQRDAVLGLVDKGVLTPQQAEAVLTELEGRAVERSTGPVWEVLGYLGGALVMGGASLLFSLTWRDLSTTTRVIILALATIMLIGVGMLIARGVRALTVPSARSRIVSVLFALGSVTAASAVGLIVSREHTWDVVWAISGFGVAVLGYLALRATPGLLATWVFSVALVFAAVGDISRHTGADDFTKYTVWLSVGLVVLGVVWAGLARARVLVQHTTAGALGVVTALVGAQYPFLFNHASWGYVVTAGIALVCFAAYFDQHDLVLLAGGVVGLTVVVPEAVSDWSGGAVSGSLAALIAGAVLLLTGGVGLRWHQRGPRQRSELD